jgi:nucleoside-diphosphate-sugar epimerase
MRIGISGAFGFLGASFVNECVQGLSGSPGSRIVAFGANNLRHPLVDSARVETRRLDVRDRAACDAAFEGLDALVHLAGKVAFDRASAKATWEVNAVGAINAIDAALAAGARTVVHVSSISALGAAPKGRLASEGNDPFAPETRASTELRSWEQALAYANLSAKGDFSFLKRLDVPYVDSKIAAEAVARDRSSRGADVRIVYPGTAIGPGDVHDAIGELLYRIAMGKLGIAPAGGTSYVDSRDFARGLYLALERGTQGGRYVISGKDEDNYLYKDFFATVGSLFGRRKPIMLSKAIAPALGALAETFAPRSGISRGLARSGGIDQRFSSAMAKASLGYEPRAKLLESVLECLAYYADHKGLTLPSARNAALNGELHG